MTRWSFLQHCYERPPDKSLGFTHQSLWRLRRAALGDRIPDNIEDHQVAIIIAVENGPTYYRVLDLWDPRSIGIPPMRRWNEVHRHYFENLSWWNSMRPLIIRYINLSTVIGRAFDDQLRQEFTMEVVCEGNDSL